GQDALARIPRANSAREEWSRSTPESLLRLSAASAALHRAPFVHSQLHSGDSTAHQLRLGNTQREARAGGSNGETAKLIWLEGRHAHTQSSPAPVPQEFAQGECTFD